MSSRREPLLWLQCLAIGAMPLELLMLRLVLAGADFGPLPGLERVFTWAIGVLGPAVLLWQRPPDWASLLLVRQPLSNRTVLQRQCSAAQSGRPIKLLGASGAIALLLVLWQIDGSALLVSDLSPLGHGSRLGSLLLAAPLLALLLWQWQQLVQAAWLLTRDAATLSAFPAITDAELQKSTTSLGLGVLNLPALDHAPTAPKPSRAASSDGESDAATDAASDAESEDPSILAGTVEPEQTTKEHNSADLNREVAQNDAVASADPETHHEQTEPSGSEQSDPQQPSQSSPGSP